MTLFYLAQIVDALIKVLLVLNRLIVRFPSRYKERQEQLFNIYQAASFLNISVHNIKILVSRQEIPYYKIGKMIVFSKQELLAIVLSIRKESIYGLEKKLVRRKMTFERMVALLLDCLNILLLILRVCGEQLSVTHPILIDGSIFLIIIKMFTWILRNSGRRFLSFP